MNPAVGEAITNCGFGALSDANENGDPATGVSSPRAVSILKTEMELGTEGEVPWFSRKRSWPEELTAALTGLEHTAGAVQAGVGGVAVPTGVSTPATRSILKPATVFDVRYGT